MNQNTIIPVPIGDGLDASPNTWLLQPPKAAEVQNFDLVGDGAYRKRSGFAHVAALEGGDGAILLPQRNGLGVLGPNGLSVLADGTLRTQSFGAAIPTQVNTWRVYSFRGAVSGAQIAYNGGYVGLALTEADAEEGRRAVVVVVDASTWTIVAGPYSLPKLAHGVRVEPIGASSFLFLGVDIPSGTRTAPEVTGTLYGAVLSPGSPQPAPIPLHSITAYDAHSRNILYDSHGVAGQDYAYVCFNDAGTLYAGRVDASCVITTSSIRELPAGGNIAIWHHVLGDTVLVYNVATQHIDYNRGDLSLAWGSTSASIVGTLPVFHERVEGGFTRLWLTDRPLTLLGNSPATPTAFASDHMTPTLHRRPQPRTREGAYFFHRYTVAEIENYGDRLLTGGEQITTNERASIPGTTASAYFERHVVPLGQGRTDLWYMDHFHAYYWYDDGATSRALYGVMGQSAKHGTTLYVPQLVANSAYLPPPWQKTYSVRNRIPALLDTPTSSSISGSDLASANQANFGRAILSDGEGGFWQTNDIAHRTGGSNINEGVLQLVVEEVDTASSAASAADLFGSVVVAAGALSVFDGSVSLPATLEPPTYVDLESTHSQPDVFYRFPDTTTTASEGFKVDNEQCVSFRGVLFTIDRNGVKYRSDSFTMGYIENMEGRTVAYFPKWFLTLTQSHRSLIFAGRKLGVEVYVSQEYPYTTPQTDEPGSHTFALRTAVQYDAVNDQFFVSGATLWNTDQDRADSLGRSLFNFNPTDLYTQTELGPQLPPASNVLAHAGNYLFLLPSEDPWTVWHSKPITAGIGPEFHSTLTVRMPPESGGCVSLAGEADRVLFLCKNGVYELFVAGSGPDAEGSGGFPPLRKVYGGDGCLTHACTVTGPFGVFFVSESGPKIVGREGNLVDFGRTLGGDPTGFRTAVFSPITKEVWLSRGEDGYILDTARMAWTYTDRPLVTATIWNGALYRVSTDGSLLRASASEVQDGDQSYQAKYVSPWLVLTGHLGFARVRKVAVLIQPLQTGNGQIRVSLAYDYVDEDIDTFTYDFGEAVTLDKPIQIMVRPTRQKLDAIRITVEDIREA